jgi:threonine synthase
MKFYSTNRKSAHVSFEQAVMKGLADDGGLFMPEIIPTFEKVFFSNLEKYSFQELAFSIAKKFVEDEIGEDKLEKIILDSINFPAPVVPLNENISVLELFHGPTLAFKDFGARFMAKTMEFFNSKENKELNILVATSGDTGSAVANGFYEIEGISVFVLYPKGKVSYLQEKQITTMDKNITALEIDGTFDDCQRLVKAAFVDNQLKNKLNLSSANSINFARLLPQTFYYFEAFKQLQNKNGKVIFSVPSGNLGNLTAGLIAKKMGLPITKFTAAVNSNSVFSEYLSTGKYFPRQSITTLSNAMDVGAPSNLSRIRELYSDKHDEIQHDIYSDSTSDEVTLKTIHEAYNKHKYIFDPHGAVGYNSVNNYIKKNNLINYSAVVLETAHPAKFLDAVEKELKIKIEIPERLKICLHKEKKSIQLSAEYSDFKNFLLRNS